ncbi:hypothetical protein MJ579_25460 [Klebsiella pneumoniae]|nr:hypothetical protein MJ579_25460 [Klebsiella pneumoniae]
MFTRGETQARRPPRLWVPHGDAQNIDELMGERTDSFLFHSHPSVLRRRNWHFVGSPKRREIGHGRLAKRGVLAVMLTTEEFPYTKGIEITESNGSSSMASVCGASLALMDAEAGKSRGGYRTVW